MSAALDLIQDVMESDAGLPFREELDNRWPVKRASLPATFALLTITREDLVEAHVNQAEMSLLADEDLATIGQTMRDHYVHDLFWPELEYHLTAILETKQTRSPQQRLAEATAEDQPFYRWMGAIDQQIWQLAGCSVYDLPDTNFRVLFNDEMAAAEVANNILQEAGLDFRG